MEKIITKSTRDFLLRPSIDELFNNREELNNYFRVKMLDEIEDLVNIKVKETALQYFFNSDAIWYLKTEEKYTYLKIVLSEFGTDEITEEYLRNLISENEQTIIEIINTSSESNNTTYSYDELDDFEADEEHFRNITG